MIDGLAGPRGAGQPDLPKHRAPPSKENRAMAAPNPDPNPESRPVIILDEWEQSQRARAILVQDHHGVVHEIPPPELWADGLTTAAAAGDLEAAGPMLLGTDGYKAWVAGGGSATMLFALIGEKFDMSPGESPASST